MKKQTSIVLLAALTWLNAYQIGDASEDAAEAIQSSLQTAPLSRPILAAPALPDDDDDADLPFIVSQALVHNPVSFYIGQSLFRSLAGIHSFASHNLLAIHLRNLSPPQRIDARASTVSLRPHFLFVTSQRSHAPPLPIL
jgi:hypothetical protein